MQKLANLILVIVASAVSIESSNDLTWSQEIQLRRQDLIKSSIEIGHSDDVLLGDAGCEVFLVEKEVFRAVDFRKQCKIQERLRLRRKKQSKLSHTGKYLAYSKDKSVSIFSTKTGTLVGKFSDDAIKSVEVMAFGTNDSMIVAVGEEAVCFWDIESGNLVKKLDSLSISITFGKISFSDDAKYLAAGDYDNKQMVVLECESGQPIVELEIPKGEFHSIHSGLVDLKFSPDVKSIAALTKGPDSEQRRVLVWNQKGELTYDHLFSRVGMREYSGISRQISWFPDGKSVLAEGNILDLESGLIVMAFANSQHHDCDFTILDQNTVIGRTSTLPRQISQVTIPWSEINASLSAIENKAPAFLYPGMTVDIRYKFGKLLGKGDRSEIPLTHALTKKLETCQIKVNRRSQNQMVLEFSEKKVGRVVRGFLNIDFLTDTQTRPVWTFSSSADSSSSYSSNTTLENLRRDMQFFLAKKIQSVDIPVFAPESKDLIPLPVIVE